MRVVCYCRYWKTEARAYCKHQAEMHRSHSVATFLEVSLRSYADAVPLVCCHYSWCLQHVDSGVGEAEGHEGPSNPHDGRAVELLRTQDGALRALAEMGMKMPEMKEHATSNGCLH